MGTLKQELYGELEVSGREKDIIEISCLQKMKRRNGDSSVSFDLVQVERVNIPWLIEQLQKELK